MLGSGTALDPYQVATAADMDDVRDNLAAYYLQTADINLSGFANWVPIGNNSTPFTGFYDGGNHAITNMTLTYTTEDYLGLFGKVNNETDEYALKNITIAGTITGDSDIGMLTGYLQGDMYNCHSSGTITGRQHIGGLAGNVYTTTRSLNTYGCDSSVDITASEDWYGSYGGLIGNYYMGSTTSVIEKCFATGDVYCAGQNSSNCGGFIGSVLSSTKTLTFKNCYARGNVTCAIYAGGFVGSTYNIAAYPSHYENCYATGAVVLLPGYVADGQGGFCGKLRGTGATDPTTSCYYDSETSGMSDTGKGTPKTTAEMKLEATFVDWDFSIIWEMESAWHDDCSATNNWTPVYYADGTTLIVDTGAIMPESVEMGPSDTGYAELQLVHGISVVDDFELDFDVSIPAFSPADDAGQYFQIKLFTNTSYLEFYFDAGYEAHKPATITAGKYGDYGSPLGITLPFDGILKVQRVGDLVSFYAGATKIHEFTDSSGFTITGIYPTWSCSSDTESFTWNGPKINDIAISGVSGYPIFKESLALQTGKNYVVVTLDPTGSMTYDGKVYKFGATLEAFTKVTHATAGESATYEYGGTPVVYSETSYKFLASGITAPAEPGGFGSYLPDTSRTVQSLADREAFVNFYYIVPLVTVTTDSIADETLDGFTTNITLADGGGAGDILHAGFVWGTATGPTLEANAYIDLGAVALGSYAPAYAGADVQPDTTYYVRGFAVTADGTYYGNELTFSVPAVLPTVTTDKVDTTSKTGFSVELSVTALGDKSVTYGFCWGTVAAPKIGDGSTNVEVGSMTTPKTVRINYAGTVAVDTPYYVAAYATNSAGTSYGADVTFTVASAFYWDFIATPDHDRLNNLDQDNHPQYHNDARGDARYSKSADLAAVTDGASGADQVGMTPIEELGDVNTVQEALEGMMGLLTDFMALMMDAGFIFEE